MLEKISHITTIVQNIAVIVGLVIGGWWATKTFIFENPRFYETGLMAAGYENSLILGEITANKIGKSDYYKVSVLLKNTHKTHDLATSKEIPIVISKIEGGMVTEKVIEKHFISNNESLKIIAPVGGVKEYKTLVKFPEKGVYLIEYNPCGSRNTLCLIQEIINID